MKNAMRFLIIIFLLFTICHKYSTRTGTEQITYDASLRTMDAGNIGVVKLKANVHLDTLKQKVVSMPISTAE